MTGIAGGTVSEAAIESMMEVLEHESWYGTERFADGKGGVGLLHHGERDSSSHAS